VADSNTGPRRHYGGMAAEERRAERRQRLLDAGLDLLGRRGWHATTVTAVCEHARLTPRYFYESFADRDELLLAIFDSIITSVADEAAAAVGATPSMEGTIRAAITAWVRAATNDPRMARVAFVEALGSEALMRRRIQAMRHFAEQLTDQARRLYPNAVDSRLAMAGRIVAGGLIETMIEWVEGRSDRPPENLVEDYTRLCSATFEAATTEAWTAP
jgi:AcrR family transcriptional regulator